MAEATKNHNVVIVTSQGVQIKVDKDLFDDIILLTAIRESQKDNPVAIADLYVKICGPDIDAINKKLMNASGRVPMAKVKKLVQDVDKALSKNS